MFEFKLPDVGEGMHEAEILRWLVKPGQQVKLDQPMLEIQTDKAVVEIPAPVSGQVELIRFQEGQIAHVGDVLIRFETAKVSTPNVATVTHIAVAPVTTSGTSLNLPKPGSVRAAPAVRKRAVELEVDLSQVKAGNPDGRIVLQDVEHYAKERRQNDKVANVPAIPSVKKEVVSNPPQTIEATLASEERQPLTGLRRRIAERMEQSWRTIPHVSVFDEADASELVAIRQRLQATAEKRGTRLTYLPLIVKAVIQVLGRFPAFNASFEEASRSIVYKRYYHIGLATATPEGLVVPVVRDANHLTLLSLASEINRLSEGGRIRKLKPEELSGSTFTISNVGSYGGQTGTAIINPPESAILAIGKIQERPFVQSGHLVACPTLPLSVSFDHRLIDGAEAGAFLGFLKELLENPSLLLLDLI